ncbi:hypothetical protein [Nocardioides sp. URHA0020]|uniref:hypothetical protein n=1 Tax=Nocardioides sp. URHA0020 TaxID=1380392 RepID=UPI0012DDE26B|nr:hypothetical protein [Nocardioides sp. URHA0020]
MKTTSSKPSAVTVLGLGVIVVLLVLASTGGAVAGALITGKQIKDGTITAADIRNRSVATTDLAPATLRALSGRTGRAGPAGQRGPVGATGPAGAAGMKDVTVRSSTVSGQWVADVQLLCHADERAISAGVFTQTTGEAVPYVVMDSPIKAGFHKVFDGEQLGLGGGWWAIVQNTGTNGTVSATLNVLCAKD